VLKFRRELEAKHEVIYREFDDEPQFVEEVKKHLKAYARADEFALMLAEQVAKDRGDLEKARELWTTARELYAKIGMKPDTEELQAWLDELDEPKGDGSSEE
jgi:DNA replication protein DnaD